MTAFSGKDNPAVMPALVLAYLGDVVFELYVRRYLISCGYTKVDYLHKQAIRFVNAVTQAKILHALMDQLEEDEAAVVRRGRNAKPGSAPKNISTVDYRHGTAFEALIGYLYISNREDRINEIFELAQKIVMSEEAGDTK